jgi:predicted DCC family thiol-disulfide oxidoreductase YuxK
MSPPPPILLYDATCGFCSAMVRFVLRHDRRGTVQFAPLSGRTAGEIARRHPALAGADSAVWVDRTPRETVVLRSDAVLRAAAYLGGPWNLARMARVLPRPIRDHAYDWVARHRHRLAGPACLVPAPGDRSRFLD